jgi:hypothetical protein
LGAAVRFDTVPETPARERYQFVDGHGRRTHFSTKVRAKLERDKAKALFTQEGKLAADVDGQHPFRGEISVGSQPFEIMYSLRMVAGK